MKRVDALYSISDLHLGGTAGFQMFNQGKALAAFVERLAEQKVTPHGTALVLNGDVFDYLAEPQDQGPQRYLDADKAHSRTERIVEDPAFANIWQALRGFLEKERCTLIIAMGNHDVELGLPEVTAYLRDTLTDGVAARSSRLHFSLDGTGVRCQVGDKRVFLIHGNEVDDANVVDFEALRRLVRSRKGGYPGPSWVPNPGTKLVIDVMNEVKRDYPFVDLLKPETAAVLPILLALRPSLLSRLGGLARVGLRWAASKAKRNLTLGGMEELSDREAIAQLLSIESLEPVGSDDRLDAILADVERQYRGEAPTAFLSAETLGVAEGAKDFAKEELRLELRRYMSQSQAFEVGFEDAQCKALFGRVNPESVDVLIAGHTHLERFIARGDSPAGHEAERVYMNTGTWARLIPLTDAWLDKDKFDELLTIFRRGSFEALDSANGLIDQRRTVAVVRSTDDGVYAELQRAGCDGSLVAHPERPFRRKLI